MSFKRWLFLSIFLFVIGLAWGLSVSADMPGLLAKDIAALEKIEPDSMTPFDKKKMVKKLSREMKQYADEMNFESAILLRNKIRELK